MPYSTNSREDSQYFRRTAARTKSINVSNRIFRGGIRF